MIRLRLERDPRDVRWTRIFVITEQGEAVEISALVQKVIWTHKAGELPVCTLEMLPGKVGPDHSALPVGDAGLYAVGDVIHCTVGAQHRFSPAAQLQAELVLRGRP